NHKRLATSPSMSVGPRIASTVDNLTHLRSLQTCPSRQHCGKNRTGDLSTALLSLAQIECSLKLDANCAAAYLARGMLLNDTKQCERAADALADATRLAPDMIEAWAERLKAYRALGKQALADADHQKWCKLIR